MIAYLCVHLWILLPESCLNENHGRRMLWLKPENDEKQSIWDSDGDYYKQAVFDVPPTRGDEESKFSVCACTKIMRLCVCAGGAECPLLSKQQWSHLLPSDWRVRWRFDLIQDQTPKAFYFYLSARRAAS